MCGNRYNVDVAATEGAGTGKNNRHNELQASTKEQLTDAISICTRSSQGGTVPRRYCTPWRCRMVESLRDGDEPIKIMGIELTKVSPRVPACCLRARQCLRAELMATDALQGFYDSVVGLVSSAGLLLLSSIIDWI